MKTRMWVIFIAVCLFWLALSSLVSILFINSMPNIMACVLVSVGLIMNGVNVLRDSSKLEAYSNPYDLSIVAPIFLGVAAFEILGWYSQQGERAVSRAFDVFLVSGLGLIFIIIGFLIILRYKRIRDD
jgi:hypothetical protein